MREPDIGSKRHKLILLKIVKNNNKKIAQCQCECGNICNILLGNFGFTKSCGCVRGQNLINKKFGKLTVISKHHNNKNQVIWLCKCECGNNIYVKTTRLNSKKTKSCGCLRNRKQKDNPIYLGYEQISGSLWSNYKYHANTRNLPFDITIEYAWQQYELQKGLCNLSKVPIVFGRKAHTETTASLDRIDNTKGYIEGNIQWVHKKINQIKMDLQIDDFYNLCKLVTSNHKSNKFYDSEIKIDFQDVLIIPNESIIESRSEIKLIREFKIQNKLLKCIPIISSNIDATSTISMFKELSKHNLLTCLHKFHNYENLKKELKEYDNICISIGLDDCNLIKLEDLINELNINIICLDVPNGYIAKFHNHIYKIKNKFPNQIIMAGNICTPEGVELLINSGADIIKCGIGSSQVCTTRYMTGVGFPQLSACIECAQAAHERQCYLVSDGGCVNISDIVKAYVAGADFVMLGTMFGGHIENELNIDNDKIPLSGMASKIAMDKYNKNIDYRSPEGRTIYLSNKGNVENTIINILNGLRSACAYLGAKNLVELQSAKFIQVQRQHFDYFK